MEFGFRLVDDVKDDFFGGIPIDGVPHLGFIYIHIGKAILEIPPIGLVFVMWRLIYGSVEPRQVFQ